MSSKREITYALDFRAGKSPDRKPREVELACRSIPRIARLMALAIRFEGLLREEKIRDYAELARLGRVTRARMTQIMKLLDLAPDLQEQILFLPNIQGLNERNLRPIVRKINWDEQRCMFQKITDGLDRARHSAWEFHQQSFQFAWAPPQPVVGWNSESQRRSWSSTRSGAPKKFYTSNVPR
jgi:hypothetical protein